MFKKENGITLVALVITIIVLLILAGVSISMISGDDGIATRASSAKTETDEGNARGALELAIASANTDYWAKFAEGKATDADKVDNLTELNTFLTKQGYTVKDHNDTTLEAGKDKAITITKADGTAPYNFTIVVGESGLITGVK